MAPKKLEKKLRKEEKVKKAITIENKKEIVQKYESGNTLWVFPLFLMGKIVLTYDQLELRPALTNELSS
jgi:hypothetical protein